MPHMPDSHHDTHDLELVAAFAAGDATGAGLESATALVASCSDCAALHHDLRTIAAALPAMPAPVRPRDFRLSPEQAASLRPSGLRGLLAALASPKLSFTTPLGTGLAALGVIGILVASGGLPAGGATAQRSAIVVEDASQLTIQAPAGAEAAAGAAAEASAAALAAGPSVDPDSKLGTDGGAATDPVATESASGAAPDSDAGPDPALVLAVLLVFAGAALVAGRAVATRVARAP